MHSTEVARGTWRDGNKKAAPDIGRLEVAICAKSYRIEN